MNDKGKFMRKNTLPFKEETESSFSAKSPQVTVHNISGEIPEKKVETGVGELIRITGVSTVNFFNLANGAKVWLTSTLTDNKEPNRIMLGICEINAYQDSFTAANIIHYGGNVGGTSFRTTSNFDYANNNNLAGASVQVVNPGKAITFTYSIYNGSGSTKSIGFKVRWRYIGRETGGS